MVVLWIVNITPPEALILLNGKGQLKGSGGWIIGAADALHNFKDIEDLYIASISPLVNDLIFLKGKNNKYILIPFGKGNKKRNNDYCYYWTRIKELIKIREPFYELAHIEVCTDNKNPKEIAKTQYCGIPK